MALVPGQYRLNLVYGDIDLDGTVGLFDFLGQIQFSYSDPTWATARAPIRKAASIRDRAC